MTYTHLFFDLDHTLWDFETNAKQTWFLLYNEHQLNNYGINDFDAFYVQYSIHNHKLWDRYTKGFITQTELRWKRVWHTLLDYKIADEELAKVLSEKFIEILPTQTELFEHTHQVLQYLQQKNYSMSLITNGFHAVQMRKLHNTNLLRYFKNVVTSEMANANKPNRPIFDFAVAQEGVLHNECLMIGDNMEADIIGAYNAGIDSVWVNHTNEKTNKNIATFTIYSLDELRNIL